jgi:glutamyl-tRNA synthetase
VTIPPHTRFAPSPTGAQHIGNARTYLISWLMARSANGRIALRIEDIDSPRVKVGADQQAVDDLTWLGLDWDGETIVQSMRRDLYRNTLEILKKRELVYPCVCSRQDVLMAASAPHEGDEGPCYPRTCADRSSQEIPIGRPYCWRFRVRESPAFVDQVHGPVAIDITRQVGDFVIWKNDDTPAYQLAVVVDDALMGINTVIRGDDLLPSTPRQILLYREFRWPVPMYAHVPLVTGSDGRRLAKRHGDTRLQSLRSQNVPAERLIGLLAWSCGWIDRVEPMSAQDVIPLFRLSSIPRQPFVLTSEHLKSIGYTESGKS